MTEIKACPFCGASGPCYKHEPVEVRNDADDRIEELKAENERLKALLPASFRVTRTIVAPVPSAKDEPFYGQIIEKEQRND